MKNIHRFITLFALLTFSSITAIAQHTIKNVMITAFEPPYDVITVLVEDEQFDYEVSEGTEFLDNKKKKAPMEDFIKGCVIDLEYAIENRQRVAKEVALLSSLEAGKENFTGVFELAEDGFAFIDGRKVRLSDDAIIEASKKKKCNCKKGMVYLGFSELDEGDFLKVKGESGADGIVYADEVTVCKNEYTGTDRKLRTAVENSYDASGTHVVSPPAGIVLPPESLHKGNIKIGNLSYQLVDDISLQGYVNVVGNRILPDYAKDPDFQNKHEIFFRFYVIEDPIPNAFAFPNGMVFIHTGLLDLMENEAQLAAVLGHEVAHVTYEHSSSRFQSQSLLDNSIVKDVGEKFKIGLGRVVKNSLGMNEGSVGDEALDGVSNALSQTRPTDIVNLFEKSKETQADRAGLLYMYLAGYDVREAAKFWQIMGSLTGDVSFQSKLKADALGFLESNALNFEQGFFSNLTEQGAEMLAGNFLETIYTSHPLAQKRLADINQLIMSTYGQEDFSQALVGQGEYAQYVSMR